MYRVSLFKLRIANNDLIPYHFFAHVYNLAEIRLKEDKMIGEILIYDMANSSPGLLKKISPTLLTKINFVYEVFFKKTNY